MIIEERAQVSNSYTYFTLMPFILVMSLGQLDKGRHMRHDVTACIGCAGASTTVCTAAAETGLELTVENVELVLDEVRPYLMSGDTSSSTLPFLALRCERC
jgi:hypothetical protein